MPQAIPSRTTKKTAPRQAKAQAKKSPAKPAKASPAVDAIASFVDNVEQAFVTVTPELMALLRTQSDRALVKAHLLKLEAEDGISALRQRLDSASSKLIGLSREAKSETAHLLDEIAEKCMELSGRLVKTDTPKTKQ